MTARSRARVSVCLVLLIIGAAAAALIARPSGDGSSSRLARAGSGFAHDDSAGDSARAEVELVERLSREAHRAANVADTRATRRAAGDPREESDQVRNQELRTYATEGRDANSVARRFLGAFFRYELGETTLRIERALRATTTGALTRELEAAAPRVPPGAQAPPRARLARLEFVPGETRSEQLVSADFVAAVARGAERTLVAISLRRVGDSWLVDALGR